MRIGAALIELYLPDADSLKARRRVARSVAEAHNGYLTVRSELGHGSIFTMVLPAASQSSN